jgi:hypothetical protein
MLGTCAPWKRKVSEVGRALGIAPRAVEPRLAGLADVHTPFCSAIPKLLLVPTALLEAYATAAPPGLRALVAAHPVCDDVAFSAVAHAALRPVAGAPPVSPNSAMRCRFYFPPDGLGDKKAGFSSSKEHPARRDACWQRVRRAMASADPRWRGEPLFVPSTEVATCSVPRGRTRSAADFDGPYAISVERSRAAPTAPAENRTLDELSCRSG